MSGIERHEANGTHLGIPEQPLRQEHRASRVPPPPASRAPRPATRRRPQQRVEVVERVGSHEAQA